MSSEFCQFVPNDPSCQTPADDPVDDNMGPSDGEHMDMDHDDKMDDGAIMEAQLVYLSTAFFTAAHAALRTLRYRSSDTYYTAGDSIGTNYW